VLSNKMQNKKNKGENFVFSKNSGKIKIFEHPWTIIFFCRKIATLSYFDNARRRCFKNIHQVNFTYLISSLIVATLVVELSRVKLAFRMHFRCIPIRPSICRMALLCPSPAPSTATASCYFLATPIEVRSLKDKINRSTGMSLNVRIFRNNHVRIFYTVIVILNAVLKIKFQRQ